MSGTFLDTNVLLYLLSDDEDKARRAETVVREGGVISVQVLNEILSVTRRKIGMSWKEIETLMTLIQSLCTVKHLTIKTHNQGRLIAERYGVSVYDAMIIAAALLAGCTVLYSEDMQHGLLVEQQLRICNPFLV